MIDHGHASGQVSTQRRQRLVRTCAYTMTLVIACWVSRCEMECLELGVPCSVYGDRLMPWASSHATLCHYHSTTVLAGRCTASRRFPGHALIKDKVFADCHVYNISIHYTVAVKV